MTVVSTFAELLGVYVSARVRTLGSYAIATIFNMSNFRALYIVIWFFLLVNDVTVLKLIVIASIHLLVQLTAAKR